MDSINEITAMILCNYPFYMNDLENLQSNWNVIDNRINEILTIDVYNQCLSLIPLYDIFYYSSIKDNSNIDLIKETFKVNLKQLFAKTNKALIKIIQNYPEKVRNDVFYMFTEKTANKILECKTIEELNDTLNKNFNILYLMMTSARANIWKDNKTNLPSTYINYNNIELAIVILMNSIFSYYGDYNQSGGKCFDIKFIEPVELKLWNQIDYYTSDYSDKLSFDITVNNSKTTFKNSSNELIKYENNTLFITELLLNSQNPFDIDYELIPNISADMYSINDILQISEDYKKQSNKPWNTFADVLIGFDDKDTYKNQTFKRLVYNSVLQKVCNWTLFIPLNTFFDCSNINKIHDDNNIKIKPSDLSKVNLADNTLEKLKVEDLSNEIEDIYKRANEKRELGKVLKINCMNMSNPPTETEINRYNEISKLVN